MTDKEALEIYRHAEKYPVDAAMEADAVAYDALWERIRGKEVRYSSGRELKFCPCCGRELKGEERWNG